jgi:hypothetical protein
MNNGIEGKYQVLLNFFRKKKGYLKKGNDACTYGLSLAHPEYFFEKDLIKQARKEVKKELKKGPVSTTTRDLMFPQKSLVEDFRETNRINQEKFSGVTARMDEDRIYQLRAQKLNKRLSTPTPKDTPSVQDQVGMHILLGCNHVPFHNKRLHTGIRNLMADNYDNIKGFHLMGDFADINALSSHDKGKFTAVKGMTLNDEYEACNDELDLFERVIPENTWKTYMYGNHEDRHNRWMGSMDNAKTPLMSPMEAMLLEERGYHVKNKWSQDFFTLGNDFEIFHGIYFSVHNGKAHLDKLRTSCAYVHTHRQQTYREGKMAAYNIGACADFTSKAFGYATRPMKAAWANGFAINMIDSSGRSNVTSIYVNPDGSFYFGGKLY